jgi:PA14 domain
MLHVFKPLDAFRRYTAAIALAAAFISCTQTPTAPNTIEITDENGAVATTQAVPVNGLKGDYYDNIDFTGTLKTRYDATINSNWKTAAPITGIAATTYSVRWTGQIQPAYTEEYTFSLTSSGQARLMINGVVLVNNWVEHASKVDTGKVSLQAGTKYDIRLEYARNAVQPALVKLEWQSVKQAKQIVPQKFLSTSGMYSEILWREIQQKYLPASTANTDLGTVAMVNGDYLITIAETNSFSSISAVKIAGVWKEIRRSNFDNGKLVVTDILKNKSVDFGALSDYVKMSNEEKWKIERSLHPGLETREFSSLASKAVRGVRPQAVPGALCPSCEALSDIYWSDTRDLLLYTWQVEVSIATALIGCTATAPGCVVTSLGFTVTKATYPIAVAAIASGTFFGPGWLASYLDLHKKVVKDYEDWLLCTETAQCQPKVSNPAPNPLQLEAFVGETAQGTITAKNIGYFNLLPTATSDQSWLEVSVPSLPVLENAELTISVKAKCESVGKKSGTVLLTTTTTAPDPSYKEEKRVVVELTCKSRAKLAAENLALIAALNSPTAGDMKLESVGLDDLFISQVVGVDIKEPLAGASLVIRSDPAPVTLAPKGIANIEIRGLCGNTVGVMRGEVVVYSTDSSSPTRAEVTLECRQIYKTRVYIVIHQVYKGPDGWGKIVDWVEFSSIGWDGNGNYYPGDHSNVCYSGCANGNWGSGIESAKRFLAANFGRSCSNARWDSAALPFAGVSGLTGLVCTNGTGP